MPAKINIREGNSADWASLGGVFHRAVMDGAKLYTSAQCAAWSPAPKAGPDWSLRMSKQSVMLAELAGGEPVGFISADLSGYVDCAYILPGFQGRGLFRALYTPLEDEHRKIGTRRMHVHASLHARPAFNGIGISGIAP